MKKVCTSAKNGQGMQKSTTIVRRVLHANIELCFDAAGRYRNIYYTGAKMEKLSRKINCDHPKAPL